MENTQKNFNYNNIMNATLKRLRGNRSLMAMSLKLGYTYNQYAKWESGHKTFLWQDFYKICDILKIDIKTILERIYNLSPQENKHVGEAILTLFLDYHFDGCKKSICTYLNINQQKFNRWICQQTEVPFIIILKLFAYAPQLFLSLLKELEILELLPDLRQDFASLKSKIVGDASVPWAGFVQYYIGTVEYQNLAHHDLEEIAKRLSLSRQQVEKAIQVSLENNLLKYTCDGKLQQTIETLETTKFLSSAENTKILSFLHYRSLSSILDKLKKSDIPLDTNNLTGHRVFSCSTDAAEKISNELKMSFFKILNILTEDNYPQDEVRVLLFNHFGLSRGPAKEFEFNLEAGFIPRSNTSPPFTNFTEKLSTDEHPQET